MSAARLGRSAWNLVVSTAGEVAVRLLALAYLVILARHLRPAGFGAFNTLLAYFSLAVALGNVGLDRFALRELSRDTLRSDCLLATLLALRLAAALAAAGLLLAVGYAFRGSDVTSFSAIALAMVPAGAAAVLTAGFHARERFDIPAAAAVLAALAMTGVAIVGAAAGAPLAFFVWGWLGAEVARVALLGGVALRGGWVKAFAFDAGIAREALRGALPYGVLALLGAIYFRIDIVMLDGLLGGDAVGHYAGAYRILEALALIPTLVMGVLYPRFARAAAGGGGAGTLYLGATRILLWSGLVIAAAGAALAGPFLGFLYAEDYAGARPVFVWLMVALVFLFWHAPNVTVVLAGDRLGPVVRWSFLTAGFNVVGNALLIPRQGAIGAAAATAASELLSLALFTPLVCRRLGISAAEYVRSVASPWPSRSELDLLRGIEPTASRAAEVHARG